MHPPFPKPKQVVHIDSLGQKLPASLADVWKRRAEGNIYQAMLSTLIDEVKRAKVNKDPLWAEVSCNSVIAKLEDAKQQLEVLEPYTLCPMCQGFQPEQCTACSGRGMMSKCRYDHVVPQEMKAKKP